MKTLIITFLLAVNAMGASITAVKLPEGDEFKLRAIKFDNIIYVETSGLAEFLGGEESIDFFAKTGSIELADYKLEYSLFSQYLRSGENVYNLYRKARYYNGSFYLPIRYLAEILDQVSQSDFYWTGNKLIMKPSEFNIIGINAYQKLNGILIEILLKDNLRYDAIKTDDSWLYITIADGTIDSSAFLDKIPVDAVYEVKTYQFENSAQISVRMRPKDFTFTSKLREDPLRIQILVRGEGFIDSSLSDGTEPIPFSDNKIDVIVIDAGHGGDDLGAVGPSGTLEKDIVLEIARELYRIVKNDDDFKPIMTRQDDFFIPLSERTELANSVGGDLFISIHANASATNKSARGFISFFLADAKTDQARATATLENSSIRFESSESQQQYLTDLDFTLRDMIQTEFQRESADIADIMQKKAGDIRNLRSRGVDQAGFFVLDKAYMPSVLVETAFISNVDDEKLLKDRGFRRQIAEVIYESIKEFKKKYESEN